MPRIYAAVTRLELERLAAGADLAVERWSTAPTHLTGEELEEAEYEALLDAAALAGERTPQGSRRVVLAADATSLPEAGPVVLTPARVASLHVDETTQHSDEDLLWYDASELADVIALLS